jgi:DNA mismatch endonuclease (patch repair protein)
MDTRTPEKRSEIMSLVKGKNTTPELAVRKIVFGLGYRYRLHAKELPGRPDLVFRAKRKVLFVHGCFWHGHGCAKGRAPKSRQEYWLPKIATNRRRDAKQIASLEAAGWKALVIWQCELRSEARLIGKIDRFLKKHGKSKTVKGRRSNAR